MNAFIILQQMTVIAILVLVGVYLYKRDIIDELTSKKLSVIAMDIVNPALIMSCVLSGSMTASHKDLINAIGVGAGLYAFLCLLGFIIPLFLPIRKDERKFFNLMTVYTNIGFIGIPVAKEVLSDNAMLYVIVMNVMYCLLFYTHGVTILGGDKEPFHIKKIASPGTIMAILTLVIFWFQIKVPMVLANSIIYLGNATIFITMSLLGVSIARASIKEGLRKPAIWIYTLVRMILVPVLLVFVLNAIGFSKEMVQAFCLMAAMPVGNLPLIQAEKIGEKTELLSECIMVTTILCFFTITFLMSFLF